MSVVNWMRVAISCHIFSFNPNRLISLCIFSNYTYAIEEMVSRLLAIQMYVLWGILVPFATACLYFSCCMPVSPLLLVSVFFSTGREKNDDDEVVEVWDGWQGGWIVVGGSKCSSWNLPAPQTTFWNHFSLFVISIGASCRTHRASCRTHSFRKKHSGVEERSEVM